MFFCSGTLSYIFNNFEGSRAFSEVVSEAKEAGYTEPDPRDDLSGMDVARKVNARFLFFADVCYEECLVSTSICNRFNVFASVFFILVLSAILS